MNYPSTDFVKLTLGETPRGEKKWLIAMRATANYYGWSEELPIWTPKIRRYGPGGEPIARVGNLPSLQKNGGKNLRICDSPSKRGHPAGMTHRFRVSRNCGMRELSKLAALTKQDWHWMSAPAGKRLEKCQWLAIHQTYTS